LDFGVDIGIPDRGNPMSARIVRPQIASILGWLDQALERPSEVIQVMGQLVAVSMRSSYFRIEDGDKVYSGKIHSDCLSKVEGKEINRNHIAKILVELDINETTGEEIERFILIDIEKA
jgi:hypothetical protein